MGVGGAERLVDIGDMGARIRISKTSRFSEKREREMRRMVVIMVVMGSAYRQHQRYDKLELE